MPYARCMSPAILKTALSDGKVSMACIDDKVRRLLGLIIKLGVLDAPGPSPPDPTQVLLSLSIYIYIYMY